MNRYIFIPLILFGINPYCFSLDSSSVLKYAEKNDPRALLNIFHENPNLSLIELRTFIFELKNEIEEKYKIHISLEQLKDELIRNIYQIDCEIDLTLIEETMEQLITYPVQYSFYSLKEPSQFIVLCKSKKKEPYNDNFQNLPAGIIIGGVETLAGALLWITPFRKIGAGLVIDGLRRMLNEVQSSEEKQRNNL